MVTSAIDSHNSENALFPEFSEYISNTSSVPLGTKDSKFAPLTFREGNDATPNISNDKCAFNNSDVETSRNNVIVESNMNITSPSINELSASANVNINRPLGSQPWLVANSAPSALTYNLLSRLITTPSLAMISSYRQ